MIAGNVSRIVVDPDLDPNMDPEKIVPDPGQLWIQNEFEVKLLLKSDKIWQFLNKNDQFQNINPFVQYKKFPKLKSRHSIHSILRPSIQTHFI